MRRLLTLVMLAACPHAATADDKEEASALKKQIAETEAKLAQLKTQYFKLTGEPPEFRHVGRLNLNTAAVGDCGSLSGVKTFTEIIDGTSAVLTVKVTEGVGGGFGGRVEKVKEWTNSWTIFATGITTKGQADGQVFHLTDPKTKAPRDYWGVVATRKHKGETILVLRPMEMPAKSDGGDFELRSVPDPKAEKKNDPVEVVTLTPQKGEPILLGSAGLIIATAKKEPEQRAKWEGDGTLRAVTTPVDVQVVKRDKDYSRIKLDGKEWAVESRWVPAPSK